MNTEKKWVGFIEVRDWNGSSDLGSGVKAFTNVMGIASSKDDFFQIVAENLKSLGLELITMEDCELLCERMQYFEVQDELVSLANEFAADKQVVFGTFHAYED